MTILEQKETLKMCLYSEAADIETMYFIISVAEKCLM